MDEPASLAEIPDFNAGETPAKHQKGEVLLMTVEIGDGRQDVLSIKPSDNPFDLATEFASKHGLDPVSTALLSDLIRQHKDSGKKKQSLTVEKGKTASKTANEKGSIGDVSGFRQKVRMKTTEMQGKTSVYDRLYQRKKKPEPEKPRSASVSSRQNGGSFNYGEWLYIKGVQSRDALKRTSETKKKEEVQHLEKDLTFKPTINRKSSLLSPRYHTRTEDLLIQKEATKKEKIEQLKSQTEQERLRECSFTPKINSRSQHLETSRSSAASQARFVDLFQEAAKRKERQIEREDYAVKAEFSFKPTVRGNKGEVDKGAFLERIVNSKKRFDEEMDKIRKEMVTDVDETGQKMFEPAITKDPRFERHLDEPTIHDHLYQLKDQKKQVIDRLSQELDENIKAAQRSTKVTQQSERILENFRRKAYELLFKLLDSDGDGSVGRGKCAEETLEEKTRGILEPVLREVRESRGMVDFGEFQRMMDRLMARLPLDAKSHILRRDTKPEEPPISNMKVSLTQRSLSVRSDQLASKRRESLPGDIYTRRVSEKRQTEEKMEQLKLNLDMRAMQECTFKPFTTRGKVRKES